MFITILILLVLLLFVPLPINISFGYIDKKKYLKINGKNILRDTVIKKSKKNKNIKKRMDTFKDNINFKPNDYYNFYKKVKKRIKIHKLEFYILFGLKDPFLTSNIYNILTIVEAVTCLTFNHFIPITHYKTKIFPDMNNNIFKLMGKCIFFISIAKTIGIYLMYRRYLREIRNNRSEDNVKSSNRQFT